VILFHTPLPVSSPLAAPPVAAASPTASVRGSWQKVALYFLWYLSTVAARGGIALDTIFTEATLTAKGNGAKLSFAAIQAPIMNHPAEPTPAFEQTLLKLAGDVGLLVIDQEAGRLVDSPSTLLGRLSAITRTLIEAANEAGVTLEAAAVKNLAKIADRWPRERVYPAPLDAKAEPDERLPRQLAEIDDAQDGARATLIEEGITTWIFGQPVELDLFANMQGGDLPFGLLKHVRQFVAGYEAEQCPLWLWEEAILQGYAAFRFLREHRRGRVTIDMINHQLSVGPLA
jgi:hypothetical protein